MESLAFIAIPPVLVKTNGVNVPCSTSKTRLLYNNNNNNNNNDNNNNNNNNNKCTLQVTIDPRPLNQKLDSKD